MADHKGRVIFLVHYLADHADEKHPVTTEKLISALEERGYSANRNTLRTDLSALKATERKKSNSALFIPLSPV